MWRTRIIAVALVAALAAGPARGDDAALRQRIDELEAQQRQFNEELQKLRQMLDEKPAAAPAAAAPVVAPAVVPAGTVPDGAPAPVAAPVQAAEPARVEEVERKTGILTEEIRKIREFLVLPETQELKGYYGLGPSASKVYGTTRGLSIGGYGESNFKVITENANGASDEFDLVRLVAYL
ncbi:MAG: hypothetical protein ACRERC_19245, partial [Candidatus Binatia bacterium]